MSTLTASEREHEAFFRKMDDEGICIEFQYPPIPIRSFDFVAYYKDDEEGPSGYGSTAEAAYLDLIEKTED